METTRELISLFVRLGIGLAFMTFVWFLLTIVFPELSPKSIWKSITTTSTSSANIPVSDWLPAPRQYRGLLGNAKTPTATSNVYVAPPPYDSRVNALPGTASTTSMQYKYLVYTENGMMIQNADGTLTPYDQMSVIMPDDPSQPKPATTTTLVVPQQPQGDLRPLYLRNLSLYPKSPVYKNLTFTGEARESMFDKSGKFWLIIIDNKGNMGAVGQAIATGNWAIPGWSRFNATVQVALPKDTPCTLILQSGVVQPSTQMPMRFPFAVTCTN